MGHSASPYFIENLLKILATNKLSLSEMIDNNFYMMTGYNSRIISSLAG